MGKILLSPEMLIVFVIIVVIGCGILYVVANKKWGYTEKRERELEQQSELVIKKKKGTGKGKEK